MLDRKSYIMDYCVGSHLFTFICSNFKEEQYSLNTPSKKCDMRIKNKRNAFCNTEKLQSKIDVLFHYRIIVCFLMLFNCISSYSQQASIYGIPFGSTFSKVEQILDQKLFIGKYINYDRSILEYHDVNMAGITFGSLIIFFNNTGADNIMTNARFSSCYKSNTTQLKKDREKLSRKLSQKYSYMRSYINPIGYKSYEFGFSEDYIVGELSVSVAQGGFSVDVPTPNQIS